MVIQVTKEDIEKGQKEPEPWSEWGRPFLNPVAQALKRQGFIYVYIGEGQIRLKRLPDSPTMVYDAPKIVLDFLEVAEDLEMEFLASPSTLKPFEFELEDYED